jgi:hypothetical protein
VVLRDEADRWQQKKFRRRNSQTATIKKLSTITILIHNLSHNLAHNVDKLAVLLTKLLAPASRQINSTLLAHILRRGYSSSTVGGKRCACAERRSAGMKIITLAASIRRLNRYWHEMHQENNSTLGKGEPIFPSIVAINTNGRILMRSYTTTSQVRNALTSRSHSLRITSHTGGLDSSSAGHCRGSRGDDPVELESTESSH